LVSIKGNPKLLNDLPKKKKKKKKNNISAIKKLRYSSSIDWIISWLRYLLRTLEPAKLFDKA